MRKIHKLYDILLTTTTIASHFYSGSCNFAQSIPATLCKIVESWQLALLSPKMVKSLSSHEPILSYSFSISVMTVRVSTMNSCKTPCAARSRSSTDLSWFFSTKEWIGRLPAIRRLNWICKSTSSMCMALCRSSRNERSFSSTRGK